MDYISTTEPRNVIEKIIDKGNQEKNLKKATVTHYTTNTSDLQELILTPCDGCILKDHQIDLSAAKCGFKLNKKEIREIKFKLRFI